MKELSIALFALSLCAALPARGQTYVVDTGRGTSPSGLILSGDPGVLDWTQSWHAGLVTFSTSTEITSIEAWMTVVAAGEMTTAIYAAADGPPRSSPALFSATYELDKGGPFQDWHGVSGLDWVLPAGSYWISEEPGHDSTFEGALWLNPATPLASYAESIRGTTWELNPAGQEGLDQWALRIGGAAPEPATWGLMLLGFGAMAIRLRARRSSARRTA